MTTTNDDLINDLLRRAERCDVLATDFAARPDGETDAEHERGSADAYRHAAQLARDAVAAAVAEEREACARLRTLGGGLLPKHFVAHTERIAAAIRGRAT